MSVDFAALAGAVVGGLPEIRACIFVSRDGLVLGAFPGAEEARAVGAWSRLTGLGDVERGFAAVGDEMWVFARRDRYSGLALATPASRPGVVLDRLDRALAAIAAPEAGPSSSSPTAAAPLAVRPEPARPEPSATPTRPAVAPAPRPFVAVRGAEAAPSTIDVEEAAEKERSDTTDRISLAREFSGLFPEPERRSG